MILGSRRTHFRWKETIPKKKKKFVVSRKQELAMAKTIVGFQLLLALLLIAEQQYGAVAGQNDNDALASFWNLVEATIRLRSGPAADDPASFLDDPDFLYGTFYRSRHLSDAFLWLLYRFLLPRINWFSLLPITRDEAAAGGGRSGNGDGILIRLFHVLQVESRLRRLRQRGSGLWIRKRKTLLRVSCCCNLL